MTIMSEHTKLQQYFWNETAKYQRFARAVEVEVEVAVEVDINEHRKRQREFWNESAKYQRFEREKKKKKGLDEYEEEQQETDLVAVVKDISDKYRINYENVNINDIVRFSSGGINVYALVDRIFKNSVHLTILKHKVLNGKHYFCKTDTIIHGLSSGGKNYAKFTRKIIKIGSSITEVIEKNDVKENTCIIDTSRYTEVKLENGQFLNRNGSYFKILLGKTSSPPGKYFFFKIIKETKTSLTVEELRQDENNPERFYMTGLKNQYHGWVNNDGALSKASRRIQLYE